MARTPPADPRASLDPEDWKSLRAQGHRMLDDILDYIEGIRERPVWQPIPERVRECFRSEVPRAPAELADVHDEFMRHVLPYATGNVHPGFMGWVHGGGNPAGVLAEMLAAGLNANLGGRDHAPIEVERQVVQWMRTLFGFPESASGRHVYEQLTRDFTRPTVPFYAVLRGRRADVAQFATRVSALRGSLRVLPPRRLASGVWLVDVYAGRDYLSGGSQRLVHEIRALQTPLDVLVGGGSAAFADEKSSLAGHLPAAIALVVVTTLIVLFLMTGSVILPLKALVMNALTVSAAFGFLVFVFQDGRLRGLLRYPAATGIDFTQPILLFAVAFALSTDYGVFLLARIKEYHDAGEPNEEAVARGLQRTGRIITAAALLFCAAVWTFATSRVVFVKQLGLGIGFAVLVDATLVRALLVPSLMRLLGDWNWWAPRPLRTLHRRIGLS